MLRALLLLLATGATAFTVPTTQRALFKAPVRPLSRVIARSDPVKQEFDPDLIPDSSAEAADDFYSLENNGLDGEWLPTNRHRDTVPTPATSPRGATPRSCHHSTTLATSPLRHFTTSPLHHPIS